jgi:hypothetical protein
MDSKLLLKSRPAHTKPRESFSNDREGELELDCDENTIVLDQRNDWLLSKSYKIYTLYS